MGRWGYYLTSKNININKYGMIWTGKLSTTIYRWTQENIDIKNWTISFKDNNPKTICDMIFAVRKCSKISQQPL